MDGYNGEEISSSEWDEADRRDMEEVKKPMTKEEAEKLVDELMASVALAVAHYNAITGFSGQTQIIYNKKKDQMRTKVVAALTGKEE